MPIAKFGIEQLRSRKEFETNPSTSGNAELGERQFRNPHFAIRIL
jgi:hypothetical protein